MFDNAFIGRTETPDDDALKAALGAAHKRWEELAAALEKELGITAREWNSYSRKAGWSLKLKRGERTILYLLPHQGGFRAAFVLGDKAVAAAREAGLPPAILDLIAGARRYAEGTGFRIEVCTKADAAAVRQLAGIKIAN
jgi:hypothetical protein